jgi:hypothetical protein
VELFRLTARWWLWSPIAETRERAGTLPDLRYIYVSIFATCSGRLSVQRNSSVSVSLLHLLTIFEGTFS